MKYVFFVIPVALLAGFLIWLPKPKCGEYIDPSVKLLMEQAKLHDRLAINTLWSKSRADGVQALEEYWALKGALLNDSALLDEYVSLVSVRYDLERTSRVISNIKLEPDSPGKLCLLKLLAHEIKKSSECSNEPGGELQSKH